jgi:hypothetical protein
MNVDLSGLFESKAEEIFRQASKTILGASFDPTATALISIAISLRRIADSLEHAGLPTAEMT